MADNEDTPLLDISKEISSDIDKNNDCFIKPTFIKPLKKSLQNEAEIENKLNTIETKEDIISTEKQKDISNIQKGPAQRLKENSVPIPYKEPAWSGIIPKKYTFEMIKNGVILDNIAISKPFIIVGRQSTCDIILEHPSISRFHCVIQQKIEVTGEESPGIYVYDLDSMHGTYQNKYRLKPRMYNRLKVDHMLKFGGSTRMFILQGPDEDQEEETQESVSELKALAEEKKKELAAKLKAELEKEKADSKTKDEGINWGFGEDAQEEEEDSEGEGVNPFASNDELFLEDPKKTLRGWFEREGYDNPQYNIEEVQPGVFKCSVDIPVEELKGRNSLHCSVEHRGKKKDTVIQCALEACRKLDKYGLLRQSTHKSHEKKRKEWSQDDYYDSEEDEYLDRTGDVEKKRKLRKSQLASARSDIETYESLLNQYNEVIKELDKLENQLEAAERLKKKQELTQKFESVSEMDDLDDYMWNLHSELPDKHKKATWKLEVIKLRKEETRLRKLVNVSRPVGTKPLPEREPNEEKNFILKTETKANLDNSDKQYLKQSVGKVHSAFLEEEEDRRQKLPKVNLEDDHDGVKPIPYSKPQKKLDKYRELLHKKIKISQSNIDISESNTNVSESKTNVSESNTKNSEANTKNSESITKLSELNTEISESLSNRGEIICSPSLIHVGGSIEDIDSIDKIDSAQSSEERRSIKGPFLHDTEEKTTVMEFTKPSKLPVKKMCKEKSKKSSAPPKSPFDFEEDYVGWVPPQNQSGDGRTSLNDKFGY